MISGGIHVIMYNPGIPIQLKLHQIIWYICNNDGNKRKGKC